MLTQAFAPDDAAAELADRGSTLLRGAWSAAQLAPLRQAIDSYYAERAERVAAGRATAQEVLQHEHGAGTIAMMQEQGFEDLSLLSDLFRDSAFHRLCTAHLGGDSFFAQTSRLAFRRHDPRGETRTYVPFHQDSPSQDPRVRNVLNCFLPLDPGAGQDCPGLQVVLQSGDPNYPLKAFDRPENALYDPIAIDADRVAQEFEGRLFAPVFELGDGLVFTENVIHRTYVTPQMTRPRLGFEFRVLSLSHVAHDRAPPGAGGLQLIRL